MTTYNLWLDSINGDLELDIELDDTQKQQLVDNLRSDHRVEDFALDSLADHALPFEDASEKIAKHLQVIA